MGFDLGALLRSGAAGAAGLQKGQQDRQKREEEARRQAMSEALLQSQIGNYQSLSDDRRLRREAAAKQARLKAAADAADAERQAAEDAAAVPKPDFAAAREGRAVRTEQEGDALGIAHDVLGANRTDGRFRVPDSQVIDAIREAYPNLRAGSYSRVLRTAKDQIIQREQSEGRAVAQQGGGGLLGRTADRIASNEDLQTIIGGSESTPTASTAPTTQADPKMALLQAARERAQSVGADAELLNAALAEIQGMTTEEAQAQLSQISGR